MTGDGALLGVPDLCIIALLNGLLHRLQCITSELGGHDQFPINVLDLLHHVRLKLSKGFMEAMNTFKDVGRRLDMCVGGVGAFAAEGLEDGIQELNRGQLVVEDVGPRVPPLLCRCFKLVTSQSVM